MRGTPLNVYDKEGDFLVTLSLSKGLSLQLNVRFNRRDAKDAEKVLTRNYELGTRNHQFTNMIKDGEFKLGGLIIKIGEFVEVLFFPFPVLKKRAA